MTGSNKILTVSYGTFSCTLEGFDQPFNTMQSIAEYFRDLAAEDRYFGAEPPQPDAQMLHQIAEREVQKRVEARVVDNGVALRQVEGGKRPAPAARPLVDTMPAAVDPDDVDSAPFASGDGDSVADKLSRIRAVVAKARAEKSGPVAEAEPVEDVVLSDTIEDAFAGIDTEFSAVDLDEPAMDSPRPDTPADESEPDRTLSQTLADTQADETPDADDADDGVSKLVLTDVSVPAEPTIADESDPAAETDDEQPEEIAQAADREPAAPEEVALVDVDEPAAPEEVAQAAEEGPVEAALDADEDPGDEAEAGDNSALEDSIAAALAEDEHEIVAPTATAPAPGTPVARVIKLKRRDFEAALASGDIEEIDDDEADDEDDDVIAEIDVEDETDTPALSASDETEDHAAEDEDDDLALTSGIRDLVSSSGLEPEEEDDLVAELAEVEREARQLEGEDADRKLRTLDEVIDREFALELGEDSDADVSKDDGEGEGDDADAADAQPQGEAALERLLDKTNAQLGDAEGNRRRSAIAHLKAAVAATKADGKLRKQRQEQDDEAISQFRDDLEQVVRPSRPASGADGARTAQRPRDSLVDRPAPLVLVSEQRVDKADGAISVKVKPSRPTRITADPKIDDATRGETGETFSDFAQRVGAQELPDILEAAAAYAKIVEGQEGLTRPAMLRRAASAAEGEISREEGLQSFGKLLRSGRIHKLGHGQFAIAEGAEVVERARSAMQ